MQRAGKHLPRRPRLDDPTRVGDRDAIAQPRRDAEVVRDEQHPDAALARLRGEEVEDPRLHGDVERGRRLVGDDEPRLGRERHRDHHALAQAARQLVRVAARLDRRLGDPDLVEQRGHARGVEVTRRLGDLAADAHRRVQRRHRVLEDRAEVAAEAFAPRCVASREHVGAVQAHRAAQHRLRVARQQAEGREAEHALARPRFADEAEDLPRRDLQRRAAHRVHVAGGGTEGHMEILDLECDLRFHCTSPLKIERPER